MNRLRKAWLALTGRFEPEVREVVRVIERPVIGEPTAADLYQVTTKSEYVGGGYVGANAWRHEYEYFTTCEQAHSAHPDKAVITTKALRIGCDFWVAKGLELVKPQPKPKRAKGRK